MTKTKDEHIRIFSERRTNGLRIMGVGIDRKNGGIFNKGLKWTIKAASALDKLGDPEYASKIRESKRKLQGI